MVLGASAVKIRNSTFTTPPGWVRGWVGGWGQDRESTNASPNVTHAHRPTGRTLLLRGTILNRTYRTYDTQKNYQYIIGYFYYLLLLIITTLFGPSHYGAP